MTENRSGISADPRHVEARRRYEAGENLTEVAAEYGVASATVARWARLAGARMRSYSEAQMVRYHGIRGGAERPMNPVHASLRDLERDFEAVAGARALRHVGYPLVGSENGTYGIWFYAEHTRKTVTRVVLGFDTPADAAAAIPLIQAREVIDAADVYAADVADSGDA